jgi:hypothetical protein
VIGIARKAGYHLCVRRRVAAFLAVALVVPAIALAADADPKRRINPADERKATAIVLKRADFAAGWRRISTPSSDDDDLTCPYYKPIGSDLTITGDAESEFERTGGIPSVLSYADIYISTKDAAAAWTRTVKLAAARCFADFFKKEAAADPDVTVTGVTYGKLAFPRLAPRTAAFRIGMTMNVSQGGETAKVPIAIHLVVVGRGRAEAGMITFAPKPGVPAAELRAFGKLMADRMKAAGF